MHIGRRSTCDARRGLAANAVWIPPGTPLCGSRRTSRPTAQTHFPLLSLTSWKKNTSSTVGNPALRASTVRRSTCVCDEAHDEYPDGDVHYGVNGRYAVTRRDSRERSKCRRECNDARTDPEWVGAKPTRRRNGERENRCIIEESPHVARPPGVKAAVVYDRRDTDTQKSDRDGIGRPLNRLRNRCALDQYAR